MYGGLSNLIVSQVLQNLPFEPFFNRRVMSCDEICKSNYGGNGKF